MSTVDRSPEGVNHDFAIALVDSAGADDLDLAGW